MIPIEHLETWRTSAGWRTAEDAERDLIALRAAVSVFADPFLADRLVLRGSIARERLDPPAPRRRVVDLDVSLREGLDPEAESRRILSRIVLALTPWLGPGRPAWHWRYPKAMFRYRSTASPDVPQTFEVQVGIDETYLDPPVRGTLSVTNGWWSGSAAVTAFGPMTHAATKLRAYCRRHHGTDLLDLDTIARRLAPDPDVLTAAFTLVAERERARVPANHLARHAAEKRAHAPALTAEIAAAMPEGGLWTLDDTLAVIERVEQDWLSRVPAEVLAWGDAPS